MRSTSPAIVCAFFLFSAFLPLEAQKPAAQSNQSDDSFVAGLLQAHLPLTLDGSHLYQAIPANALPGGAFRPKTIQLNLDTITKPLLPGDYVIPMTFFCSEYSVHRSGGGIAYTLGPAEGQASKAISTLLWRGMLLGKTPQELQAISWSIQSSVPYFKMPASYKKTIDEVIPDMKGQLAGQGMDQIENAWQNKVDAGVNKVSNALDRGLQRITAGRGHVKVQAQVELQNSFARLAGGREPFATLARLALDSTKIADTVTNKGLSDEMREQNLYAGQGSQLPPMPSANGPWTIASPGLMYVRFIVNSGNLHADNLLQIRVLRNSMATNVTSEARLVPASYSQASSATVTGTPSVVQIFGGNFNEAGYASCVAGGKSVVYCAAENIDITGLMAYAIGYGAQVSDIAPAAPIGSASPPLSPLLERVCVKKLIYQPTYKPKSQIVGQCIYLAVIEADGTACAGFDTAEVPSGKKLSWVQTFETNIPSNTSASCSAGVAHKDPCNPDTTNSDTTKRDTPPLYRSTIQNKIFQEGDDFVSWQTAVGKAGLGKLKMLFRDMPGRQIGAVQTSWHWLTVADPQIQLPSNLKDPLDNYLRLVSYVEGDEATYNSLIDVQYGIRVVSNKASQDGSFIHSNLLIVGTKNSYPYSGGIYQLGFLKTLVLDERRMPQACLVEGDGKNEPPLGDPPSFLPRVFPVREPSPKKQ